MRKALFLHTQKTAGTSIQEMAREVYGDQNVASHDDYRTLGMGGCANMPFVSGHFGIEFARPLLAGRYCFTFLREPIARVLSLYKFCASQKSDDWPIYAVARKTTFNEFLQLAIKGNEDVCHAVWNHQVWQLAFGHGAGLAGVDQANIADFEPMDLLAIATKNLRCFNYIGFVETFEYDAAEVFRQLGWPNPEVRRSNVSDTGPTVGDLPSDTINLVRMVTELDRLLYRHVWLQR